MNYLKLYKELFIQHSNVEIMGEKDFYQFMKRANRDLSARARYIIVEIIIEIMNDKTFTMINEERETDE
tara:strand:- start:8238 stop:8444 length:207 start_codon:yes stop_codon:yes gene_type:complete